MCKNKSKCELNENEAKHSTQYVFYISHSILVLCLHNELPTYVCNVYNKNILTVSNKENRFSTFAEYRAFPSKQMLFLFFFHIYLATSSSCRSVAAFLSQKTEKKIMQNEKNKFRNVNYVKCDTILRFDFSFLFFSFASSPALVSILFGSARLVILIHGRPIIMRVWGRFASPGTQSSTVVFYENVRDEVI